jgi:hypothetical protein
MIHRLLRLCLLFTLAAGHAFSQTGGNNTFEFLNLPSSARLAALGGSFVSVLDNDLNMAAQNPSLLNQEMKHMLALNMAPYFADIHFGYAAFGFEIKKVGMLSTGIHFINYGTFDRADETGLKTGTFTAAEYSFNVAWSKKLHENIRGGITLKTVYSRLESYLSHGLLADIGMHYQSPSGHFSAGLVVRHAGRQLKPYTEGNRQPVPFEILSGFSYRLPRAPLRLNMTVTHLEKWNLGYINPREQGRIDPLTGDTTFLTVSLFEKIARHLIPSAEILITRDFHLRFAYNFMRRRDLIFDTVRSLSGLSFGTGFRLSRFKFDYALAFYNVAGRSHHFSLTTYLGKKSSTTIGTDSHSD